MTRENTTRAAISYTCSEYREEMILLALQQRLQHPELTKKEREELTEEIARLAEKIGL